MLLVLIADTKGPVPGTDITYIKPELAVAVLYTSRVQL